MRRQPHADEEEVPQELHVRGSLRVEVRHVRVEGEEGPAQDDVGDEEGPEEMHAEVPLDLVVRKSEAPGVEHMVDAPPAAPGASSVAARDARRQKCLGHQSTTTFLVRPSQTKLEKS